MPGLAKSSPGLARKRRRTGTNDVTSSKTKKHHKDDRPTEEDTKEHLQSLEKQILGSRRHYNNIASLVKYAQTSISSEKTSISSKSKKYRLAVLSLCRTFSGLMARGHFKISKQDNENENVVQLWLMDRYLEYQDILFAVLHCDDSDLQPRRLSVKLLMRLWKDEAECWKLAGSAQWNSGILFRLLQTLITIESGSSLVTEFVESFVAPYADVKFYTLKIITHTALGKHGLPRLGSLVAVLGRLEVPQEATSDSDTLYLKSMAKGTEARRSSPAVKRAAQDAWVSILGSKMSKAQRKLLLSLMDSRIVPWFQKAEILMDFLTDSFDSGGSTSLMALSGLFHLMRERNLDYPYFYQKLYSLLDTSILHSKHRSRIFRLLDTFLSSTHLPVALVASFIKRLSRLCLYAPPSSTVFTAPWIYNLLRNHPSCTFMIHREPGKANSCVEKESGTFEDSFEINQRDPMLTRAIESSLWEIKTLQNHYHPNVATIARIISEPFTKQAYNLEDFLDHSYDSMLAVELSKAMKRQPVVEYHIPKYVFPIQDRKSLLGGISISSQLWDFHT